jgi:RNA polymerase sigma-70 factor (ECF subfamily)
MDSAASGITALLAKVASGDREAEARLFPLVYQELRQLAGRVFRGERPDHTLQATALVHEAYLRILGNSDVSWQNRSHFFAVAARTMRRILVDHARRRQANKRKGTTISLESAIVFSEDQSSELVALDDALTRLSEWDPRQSRIVELRFFTGMSEAEIAAVLGVSVRTVKRDWCMAKAWLYGELKRDLNDARQMGTD